MLSLIFITFATGLPTVWAGYDNIIQGTTCVSNVADLQGVGQCLDKTYGCNSGYARIYGPYPSISCKGAAGGYYFDWQTGCGHKITVNGKCSSGSTKVDCSCYGDACNDPERCDDV